MKYIYKKINNIYMSPYVENFDIYIKTIFVKSTYIKTNVVKCHISVVKSTYIKTIVVKCHISAVKSTYIKTNVKTNFEKSTYAQKMRIEIPLGLINLFFDFEQFPVTNFQK